MPRYFFHLRNDLDVDDQEGQEMADLEAAQQRAAAYAVDMAAASVAERRKLDLRPRVEMADETGEIVQIFEFKDVITVLN